MDLRLLLRIKLRGCAIDFGVGAGVLVEQMVTFVLPDGKSINEPVLRRAIQDAADELLESAVEVTIDRIPGTKEWEATS